MTTALNRDQLIALMVAERDAELHDRTSCGVAAFWGICQETLDREPTIFGGTSCRHVVSARTRVAVGFVHGSVIHDLVVDHW